MNQPLKAKRILLGLSGGIALYKSCELLRRLQDAGAEVRVVMTPSAEDFVSPLTFAALSNHPVYTAGANQSPSAFQHIDFPRWGDIYIIAPASANTMGKISQGLADEPVSLCYMASTAPKMIVPAMNTAMYLSSAVQRNLEQLRNDGCTIVEPDSGRMACGEVGAGRFPEIPTIIAAVQKLLTPAKLVTPTDPSSSPAKKPKAKLLITVGRTEEDIDPVRTITNKSSGITGVSIAQEFLDAGYQVSIVNGPMDAEVPRGAQSYPVKSARDMHQAVMDLQDSHDILIFCAAVADFRPKVVNEEKIKNSRDNINLELVPNPNILRSAVEQKRSGQIIVGFALETADPIAHGIAKLQKSGADFLVLNTPVKKDSGFGKDSVEFCILESQHQLENAPSLALGSKKSLAQQIRNKIEEISGV